MHLLPEILDSAEAIRDIRRNIHAHPELRFEENRTSDLVAEALSSWGIAVYRGMGKTGVVGRLDGDLGPGKMIGLRADMDALPLQEHNNFAHTSRNPGKMHACGHDGHTAMLLGAAQYLSNHRAFKGTVIFIFQPAEEGGAGAREMIKDGLFEQFPCDAVFGLHNWPGLGEGHFGVTDGPMMASSNAFEITVTGRGGHAALPHNSADPVLAGAQVVLALQSIITRNKRPVDAAVLSVTQFHAGETSNVIPDSAFIGGTVRTFTIEVLDLIEQRLREITHSIAGAFDCHAEIQFSRSYPPLINHKNEVEFASGVMSELVGKQNVNTSIDPTMGAEDFAYYSHQVPACFFRLGAGNKAKGITSGVHTPTFNIDEGAIEVGMGIMAWMGSGG